MPQRKATTDRGYAASLNATHEQICASFLGPRAENHKVLQDRFNAIVRDTLSARESFFPDDPVFIDEEIIQSAAFTGQIQKMEDYLEFLSNWLTQHCIPFFSPRYNGHMVTDPALPATLGYLVGLLWNQNNVTPEASPLTSHIEYLVGQQMCRLIGYRSSADPVPLIYPPPPIGWGHITCGGSIANLESVWVARNVKFYPLSLQLAVTEGILYFVADTFETTLCTGVKKKFAECSAWELLNLTVGEVLDLPTRLVTNYGISTTFIERAVGGYLVANTGKAVLERRFNIKPPQMVISVANHYSWPKSVSITGIGMENLIHITVDIAARMDVARLEEQLAKHLAEQQAVYAVVAISGTTEHGAIDPLLDILLLRQKYQQLGLSFYVHVDAAWGGYFCSMIPPPPTDIIPTRPTRNPNLVLEQPLSEYSQNQLFSIRYADSCTLDPHKAGYAPYPAGALCYRDERLRFMVTMTAAYINTTADMDNVGTYGVEGSKPGAAATGVWMAHHAIGLTHRGYGALLGEAMFTSVKLYANWATMTFEDPKLVVKTLVMLPSELKGLPQSEIDAETRFIIDNIVDKENDDILNNPAAMKKITELGPDLIITVFACNFYLNGKLNENVTEANFLNRRMFERFSVTHRDHDPHTRELIVGATSMEETGYGVALEKYKERLGLKGPGDLSVMTLVPMSPFPTAHNLVKSFADTFKEAALEMIDECYTRIVASPAQHTFVMQGTDRLFLAYISVFNIGNYRQQVILTAQLPADVMQTYFDEVEQDPSALFTLTTEKALLATILAEKSCEVTIYKGLNTTEPKIIATKVELSSIQVIINRSIAPEYFDASYPEFMPFYLYGTTEQQHIDHMLLLAPNAQLSAAKISFTEPLSSLAEGGILSGLIAIANTTREGAMQPFNADHTPEFFAPGRVLPVDIYRDPRASDVPGPGLLEGLGSPIASGSLTLPVSIYVDYTLVNQEQGLALSSTHSKARAPGLPDLSNRIELPSVGEPYNITPIDLSAIYNGLIAHHAADDYGHTMSIRKGWNDEFDEQMEKRGLKAI